MRWLAASLAVAAVALLAVAAWFARALVVMMVALVRFACG